jgi:hypothetical protein
VAAGRKEPRNGPLMLQYCGYRDAGNERLRSAFLAEKSEMLAARGEPGKD